VLIQNLKNIGFAAKFRKRVNIAATLASNVQFELRLSCLKIDIPGRTPTRQAFNTGDLPAKSLLNKLTDFLFCLGSGLIESDIH
jgi:hypothetical protein